MARAATHAIGSQGPEQGQSLWRRLLVAVLSIRYIQQSLILTWKNRKYIYRSLHATLATHFAVCMQLGSHLCTNLGRPSRRLPQAHKAWISIMLLSACSHRGLEEPTSYGVAAVRTLCVPSAGAGHSAGPRRQQQEVGHCSSCCARCCAAEPQHATWVLTWQCST